MNLKKTLGLLQTYGIKRAIQQGTEKLFFDARRYANIAPYTDIKPEDYLYFPTAPKLQVEGLSIILVVHRFYPEGTGGTEKFTYNLAQELVKSGNRVVVLAYSQMHHSYYDSEIGGVLYKQEVWDNLSVVKFRYKKPPADLLKDAAVTDDIIPFADWCFQQFNPLLLHFTHLSRVSALAEACRKRHKPYLVTVTDFFSVCHFTTLIRKDGQICPASRNGQNCKKYCPTSRTDTVARHKIYRQLLSGAAAVTAPSQYVCRILQREFVNLNLLAIPHGIDITLPPKTHFKKGCTKFVYAGSLCEAKGIALLITAFKFMPNTCSLDIYGSGSELYVSRLKKLTRHSPNIKFCGNVTRQEISKAFENADCVVVPSQWPETYNFVVREALSCGCLVVASHIGALPEAIIEGENGYTFETGDKDKLLEALQKALHFNFAQYRHVTFPLVEEEAQSYMFLYTHAYKSHKAVPQCPKSV